MVMAGMVHQGTERAEMSLCRGVWLFVVVLPGGQISVLYVQCLGT